MLEPRMHLGKRLSFHYTEVLKLSVQLIKL